MSVSLFKGLILSFLKHLLKVYMVIPLNDVDIIGMPRMNIGV